MSFNPYQNYGAGIAALGPVQAMSDRNEAQTYMANSGQMFASGGIARLAEGGDTALPKYKYDPATQKYVLAGADEAKTAMEAELLKKKQAGESSGESYAPQQPSEWSQKTPAERAAYYADRPIQAGLARGVQNLVGVTGLGSLAKFVNPDAWHSSYAEKLGFDPSQTSFGRGAGSLFGFFGSPQEATPKAGVDAYGYAPVGANTNYGGVLGGWGVTQEGDMGLSSQTPGYSQAGDSQAANNDGGGYTSDQAGGGWGGNDSGYASGESGVYAQGGLAALAGGGQSHLGDYSDGGRLLRGPGDGVSDSIPATIGDKRPARLADGEFVVPARIVSELGNGSTEAGARKLYAMMDRIQKGRKKSIGKGRVAVNSRADKNLPA
jgi:hypothetical protein